jgi:spore germination protein (amino acid permease)
MFLEKGKISRFQLSVLVIGFVFGNSVIISPGMGGGHDAWLAVILGLGEGLVIVWIYTALAKRFKDKTIVEINAQVFGKYLGKCISILFVWYIFHVGAIVLNSYTRFFKLEIYPNTPKTITLLLLMLVCASTVGRGIEVIARLGLILVPVIMMVLIVDTLLLIPNIDFNNLLPVLDMPIGKFLWAAQGAANFPFGQTVAFLMVLAFVDKPENETAAVSWGLILAGLFLTMAVARNAAVLGLMATITDYPSFLVSQVIDVGDILTRLEVLVGINLIAMGFVKILILLYGSVLGLAQVFNLRSYRPIILPVGILMVILALTNIGSSAEMFDFFTRGYPVYSFPFQVILPLIALIIAKLRKLPQTGGDDA